MGSVLPTLLSTPYLQPPNILATKAIKAKYNALGGAGSFLGPAQTELVGDAFDGYHVAYEGGSICWSRATGANVVGGGIGIKWVSLEAQRGMLGYPLTHELTTPDGVGRYNVFQHGSIYWTPATDAHEVHGAIHETATSDSLGRYSKFQKGSEKGAIYWTPSTGAYEIHGGIDAKWSSLGGEQSFLGYPTSDETPTGNSGGRYNNFQGGSIYWSPRTGVYEHRGTLPDHVDLYQNHTFADGIVAGAWTQITMSSNGQVKFSCGFPARAIAYHFVVACVLTDADQQAYTFTHEGRIAGACEPGSPDSKWNDTITNALISQNWRAIIANPVVRCDARVTTDRNILFNQVISGAGPVVSVVALF